jgi:hypothetical protein
MEEYTKYLQQQLNNIEQFKEVVSSLSTVLKRNIRLIKENEELKKENEGLKEAAKRREHLISVNRRDYKKTDGNK